eukprot:scaffold53366_cov36-Cyclotella_meneghiniana.AAC.2
MLFGGRLLASTGFAGWAVPLDSAMASLTDSILSSSGQHQPFVAEFTRLFNGTIHSMAYCVGLSPSSVQLSAPVSYGARPLPFGFRWRTYLVSLFAGRCFPRLLSFGLSCRSFTLIRVLSIAYPQTRARHLWSSEMTTPCPPLTLGTGIQSPAPIWSPTVTNSLMRLLLSRRVGGFSRLACPTP